MEDKADKIIVEGPVEEVEKVRIALLANVEDLLSKLTFADIVIDPKYHKHIIGKITHKFCVINVTNYVDLMVLYKEREDRT
jgi:hypothetical protein